VLGPQRFTTTTPVDPISSRCGECEVDAVDSPGGVNLQVVLLVYSQVVHQQSDSPVRKFTVYESTLCAPSSTRSELNHTIKCIDSRFSEVGGAGFRPDLAQVCHPVRTGSFLHKRAGYCLFKLLPP
jgi:hypothetical protein